MTEFKDIKEKIGEIAAIAKECPDNLQTICFEILLHHYLDSLRVAKQKSKDNKPAPEVDAEGEASEAERSEESKNQEDLKETELHVKVKKFLKNYTLSMDDINQIFYKEEGEIKPLYEDLATTKASEAQLRIAELQALRNAIGTGEFEFDVEQVRTECKDRKYYDQANFGAIFKNNLKKFDIDNFDKNTKTAKLSEDGRKHLSEVIKQIK